MTVTHKFTIIMDIPEKHLISSVIKTIQHVSAKTAHVALCEIHRFLSFYVKISQNWLKFLSCTQNFGVLNLKM